MSCGWGGRLLGFLSKIPKHYIAQNHPQRHLDLLKRMPEDFSYINKKVDIYKQGSEDYIPMEQSLDLCFTLLISIPRNTRMKIVKVIKSFLHKISG